MIAMHGFDLNFGASSQRRCMGGVHYPIPNSRKLSGLGMTHVVVDFRKIRHNVGRLTATRDHIVNPRTIGHMLSHKIDHMIHGLDAIQRRPPPLGRRSGMCGPAIEPDPSGFVRKRRARIRSISIGAVPVQHRINIVKQPCTNQIHFS